MLRTVFNKMAFILLYFGSASGCSEDSSFLGFQSKNQSSSQKTVKNRKEIPTGVSILATPKAKVIVNSEKLSTQKYVQTWVVPPQNRPKSVDLLLIVDKSASMKTSIEKVKNQLNTFFSNLPDIDLRVGLTLHEETYPDFHKDYNSDSAAQFMSLTRSEKEVRYNVLNFNTPSDSKTNVFFKPNVVALRGSTQIDHMKNELSSTKLVFKNGVSSENALCPALLGYQSISDSTENTVRPELSSFRKDADLFSVVIVSDEDATIASCPNLIEIKPARTSCHCSRPTGETYCSRTVIGTSNEIESYACPTDGDPDKMCTRNKVLWGCIQTPKFEHRSCDVCPCEGFQSSSCQTREHSIDFSYPHSAIPLNSLNGYIFNALDFKKKITPQRPMQINFVGFTGLNGCSPGVANPGASVGSKYLEAVNATSGLSACIQDDFAQVFKNFSEQIKVLVNNIALERNERSISYVKVNNQVLTAHQYRVQNGIMMIDSNLLQPESRVEIGYSVP